mmetsp:Transcript_13705/g.54858  ORF Transcript_13705/g.54858 Transcript_13705/m.54858 type:complete len:89 (+) Transcript_13705:3993-4259(+)
MFGTGLIRGNEGQVNLRLHSGGQLNLCLLRSLTKPLQGQSVLAQVDPFLLLELSEKVLKEMVIKILTTQVSVPVCRLDLENSTSDLED